MLTKALINLWEYFQTNKAFTSITLIALFLIIQIIVPIVKIEAVFLNFFFILFSSIAVTSAFDLLQNFLFPDDFEMDSYKKKKAQTIRTYLIEKLEIKKKKVDKIEDKNLPTFLYRAKRKQINIFIISILSFSSIVSIGIIYYDKCQQDEQREAEKRRQEEYEKLHGKFKNDSLSIVEHYDLLNDGLKYRDKDNDTTKAHDCFKKVWDLWSKDKKTTTNNRFNVCKDPLTLEIDPALFNEYLYGNTRKHEIICIEKHPMEDDQYIVLVKVREKLFDNPLRMNYEKTDSANIETIIKQAELIFEDFSHSDRDLIISHLKNGRNVVDKTTACHIRLFQIIQSKFKFKFNAKYKEEHRKTVPTFDIMIITIKPEEDNRFYFRSFDSY